jgi:hypothetical protein
MEENVHLDHFHANFHVRFVDAQVDIDAELPHMMSGRLISLPLTSHNFQLSIHSITIYRQWPPVAALVTISVTRPLLPQPAWSTATAQLAANKLAHPIKPGHSLQLTISDGLSIPENGSQPTFRSVPSVLNAVRL